LLAICSKTWEFSLLFYCKRNQQGKQANKNMSGGEELAGGTRVVFHFAGDLVEWKKGSTAWRNVSKGYTGISFFISSLCGKVALETPPVDIIICLPFEQGHANMCGNVPAAFILIFCRDKRK